MLNNQARKRKERKFYKAFVWAMQLTFVVVFWTAILSITIIGLIG